MNETLLNIVLVLVFVLIGGVFAAAEMALVSLRESQVASLASRGRRGAARRPAGRRPEPVPRRRADRRHAGRVPVRRLRRGDAGRRARADPGGPGRARTGWPTRSRSSSSRWLISYVSLVLGELAPKRLALQRAEAIAAGWSPRSSTGSPRSARPVIWLLSLSTERGRPAARRRPERGPRADHRRGAARPRHRRTSRSGSEERQIVEDVFEAGDRQIREVMVPRTEVDFLDAAMPVVQGGRAASPTSRTRATR